MGRFKTTYNIFKDFGEHFNPNWFDGNQLILPPHKEWDYKRELKIEDVDLWEVLYEASGGIAVYAAWEPYAEFYMIRVGWLLENKGYGAETYYGPGASELVKRRALELNIPLWYHTEWVEDDQMWLYQPHPEITKKHFVISSVGDFQS